MKTKNPATSASMSIFAVLILSLSNLIISHPVLAADGFDVPPDFKALEVEVLPASPSEDEGNPETWKPSVKKIRSFSEYTSQKSASYNKKVARNSALYEKKLSEKMKVYNRYRLLEYEALQKLKVEDPQAAFFWLEVRCGFTSIDSAKEPTSEVYCAFKATVQDLGKKEDPERKKIEDVYDAARDHSEKIYDAEIVKLEELYGAVREQK